MVLRSCCVELRSWSEPTANNAILILHENFGLSASIGCRHAGYMGGNTGRGKPNDEMHLSIDVRDQRRLVIGPGRALEFDRREKIKSEASYSSGMLAETRHLTIIAIFS